MEIRCAAAPPYMNEQMNIRQIAHVLEIDEDFMKQSMFQICETICTIASNGEYEVKYNLK